MANIKKEINKIKKMYGEGFMHKCKEWFPTILEKENLLLSILESNFSNNCKTLEKDITGIRQGDFIDYIRSKVPKEKRENNVENKSPYELLEEAGYDLYECNSNDDVLKFIPYYEEDEQLCTFTDSERIKKNYIFWAVKKNVDEIKRENFTNIKREDEYGTSVMSIQFKKTANSYVSIKNRYNHALKFENPDATFGNDLDRIIPGLQYSFAELLLERGSTLNPPENVGLNLPGYTIAKDGKYYKYNLEINGVYYCPGNIVIRDGEPRQVGELEEGILIDQFYVDLKEGKIKNLVENRQDAFLEGLNDIKKIEVVKSENEISERIIKLHLGEDKQVVEIGISKNNQIVEYTNNNIIEIGNNFLSLNEELKRLEMSQVENIGDVFLASNKSLKQLELPHLKSVKKAFMLLNKGLESFSAPELENVDDEFLAYNEELEYIYVPKLKTIGNSFLGTNNKIEQVVLPSVEEIGNDFMQSNECLVQLEVPNLKSKGRYFLNNHQGLVDNLENGELYIEEINDEEIDVGKIFDIEEIFADILPQDIARLDKNAKLTISEIGNAKNFIENIKENNKEKNI